LCPFDAFASPTHPSLMSRSNSETVVNLRIEGLTETFFEGNIETRGHNITTKQGGNHHCDGTNNHAHKTPGPTATSALADGSKVGHYTFDGPYDKSLDDFLITRIASNSQDKHDSWSLLLNYEFAKVGGCQLRVNVGDDVLWAYDAFDKAHILKLTGPSKAQKGVEFVVKVVDGQTGHPVQGATVEGQKTDKNGHATLVIHNTGTISFKAEKSDSIRSNALSVNVEKK